MEDNVKIYGYSNGRLEESGSLWEALEVIWKPHLVISLVGAGGKTSVMYRLAEEAAALGKRVLVTTSTHIYRPSGRRVLLAERASDVAGEAVDGEILVTGRSAPPSGSQAVESGASLSGEKLRGLPPQEIGKLAGEAEVLLIEADGARRLPFKVPGPEEPVLIPETDLVIGCCGLDCVGRELRSCCFRSGLAARLLHCPETHRVTAEEVAAVLNSPDGTRKSVGNREYRIVLNKADGEKERGAALDIMENLMRRAPVVCAVTSLSR